MVRIGKIVATHGLNGSLVLTHVVGKSTWLKKGQALHIEMQKGSYIPYFVAGCKAVNPKEYIIEVEDVNKVETAKKLVSRSVYADEAILAGYAKDSPLLWIGFLITDSHKGNIGIVEDVLQTGTQWLAKVIYQDSEVLIPLIAQMIDTIDIKKKTIMMTLPDGLLEVYTEAASRPSPAERDVVQGKKEAKQ
jgi:16S rRNA processing protein RimM